MITFADLDSRRVRILGPGAARTGGGGGGGGTLALHGPNGSDPGAAYGGGYG
jgi:hypothetical protein